MLIPPKERAAFRWFAALHGAEALRALLRERAALRHDPRGLSFEPEIAAIVAEVSGGNDIEMD